MTDAFRQTPRLRRRRAAPGIPSVLRLVSSIRPLRIAKNNFGKSSTEECL